MDDNGGEQIVEIMCYSASQDTETFEPLSMLELSFQLLPFFLFRATLENIVLSPCTANSAMTLTNSPGSSVSPPNPSADA